MIRHAVLSIRKQTTVIGIAVMGVMVVELVWVGLPLWNRFVRLREEAAASRAQLAQRRVVAARPPMGERLADTVTEFWVSESDSTVQRRFLEELAAFTSPGELRMTVTPKPAHPEGAVRRYVVEVGVEGAEPAILAFLDRLLTGPSWIELEQFHIVPTGSKDAPLRGTFLLSKVVARAS